MVETSLISTVIESCTNEIYLIDASDSAYLKTNQIAQDRLNYSFAELQQMHPWQLARDFTQSEWQRQLHPLLSGARQKIIIGTRHTCKNGSQYPVLLNITADTIENRQLLVVVGKDLRFQQHTAETSLESDERCAAIKLLDVELHLYRQRLTELSAHIKHIKEQERLRIAREIHDEMGGNLVAMKMILHTLEHRLPSDQPWLAEKTHYVDTLIDRTIEAGHRISRDLRPGVLDPGIIPALDWQTKEFEKQYGIRCSFSTNQSEVVLSPDHATAIFRMAQEALTNIAKHADASCASLAIIYTRTSVSLTITDNGCGLKPGYDDKPNSFGLLGMTERCEEIGGTILINSQPGNGCVITIKIPLMNQPGKIELEPEEPQNSQLSLL